MADIKLIVDYGDVTEATKAVKGLGNAAVRASKGQIQSANSVDVVNKKSLATVHRQIAFSKKMENQKLKEAKATRTLENETHRLALKYKPLYASSKLYERSLEEINRANKLGVLNDKQRSASIARLNQQFKTGTGVFSTYANGMTKGSNRMGVAMQQTGYQVGDFLVQVQSGTNPMVAFGQQATQLVGVLYLLPQATLAAKVGIMGLKISMGVLSLGLGILIPLATALGAAFMRTREGADKASGGIKTFKDSLISAQESTKQLTIDIEMLLNKMQDTDEYIYNQAVKKAEDKLLLAQQALEAGPRGARAGTDANVKLREKAVADAQLLVDKAQEELDTHIALRKEKQGILTETQLAFKRDKKRSDDLAELMRLRFKNERLAKEKDAESEAKLAKLKSENLVEYLKLKYKNERLAKVAAKEAEQLEVKIQEALAKKTKDLNASVVKNRQDGITAYYAYEEKMAKEKETRDKRVAEIKEKERLRLVDLATKASGTKGRGGAIAPTKGQVAEMGMGSQDTEQEAKLRLQEKIFTSLVNQSKTLEYTLGLSGRELIVGRQKLEAHLLGNQLQKAGLRFGSDAYNSAVMQLEVNQERVLTAYDLAEAERLAEAEATRRNKILLDQYSKIEDELQKQADAQKQFADDIASSFGDAFMSMVDGTKSVKDAFKDMARDIIKQLYQILVVEQMVASISGAIQSVLVVEARLKVLL